MWEFHSSRTGEEGGLIDFVYVISAWPLGLGCLGRGGCVASFLGFPLNKLCAPPSAILFHSQPTRRAQAARKGSGAFVSQIRKRLREFREAFLRLRVEAAL